MPEPGVELAGMRQAGMRQAGLILLAAGASRRMGSPKQLLDVGGISMLRKATISALASPCRPVVVVLGAAADTVYTVIEGLPVRTVRNVEWEQGVGTSIHAGLREMMETDVDAAVIALADQPLLAPEVFRRLVVAWQGGGRPAVASGYAGTLGAPALFDRSLFSRLLALPPGQGCKSLLLELPGDLVEVCPCPEAEVDIDTPDDYGRWHEARRDADPR